MTSMSLRTQGLVKRYGALLVTDEVSLDIAAGELHAVIGPNGAGKTTLVNQLCGEQAPDAGRIWFGTDDVTALPVHARARSGLLRSFQITAVFEEFTVLENAAFAARAAKGHAFGFWKPLLADRAALQAAQEGLAAAGLADRADALAGNLGYGERRQLELAMALAARPRFLLLDEPMAGMGAQEAAAVVALLRQLKGRYSILLIEHDMDAVFALADRITVLVYGRAAFCGTPDEIRRHPEVAALYLGDEAPDAADAQGVAHG